MPSEIKPKVRKVADIKAALLNPALTSHFEVQIPLPNGAVRAELESIRPCLLYTSPSPRDLSTSRMPSSA